LVYLMPERQNPTGVTAGEKWRSETIEAGASSGAPFIEKGYEEAEAGLATLSARRPERGGGGGRVSKNVGTGGPSALDAGGRRGGCGGQEDGGLPNAAASPGGRRGVSPGGGGPASPAGARLRRRSEADHGREDVEASPPGDLLVGRGDRKPALLAEPAARS